MYAGNHKIFYASFYLFPTRALATYVWERCGRDMGILLSMDWTSRSSSEYKCFVIIVVELPRQLRREFWTGLTTSHESNQ